MVSAFNSNVTDYARGVCATFFEFAFQFQIRFCLEK
jgi:hypothetical protein